MSEKLSLIIEATDNASSVLGGIGKTLGNLGRVAGGLALGGIAALGAGVVKFTSDGLSLKNSMKKVTAQLNAFTKDGAKTADIIDMVRKRAAKTPFEFNEMAKAATALLPASKQAQTGLEGIIEQAEILAASNPAEGLEGAAFALKEAVSGDFTSIIERFNLPRQYINDLKKEGVPNLEIVRRAMKEMGLDVDLVSNLAETAEGRWSTFKDTLSGVAATATKPIFEAMSKGLAGVNTVLEANAPLLERVGETIAGVLTQGIAGLSSGFQHFSAILLGVVDLFTNTEDGGNSLLYALEAITGSKLPQWLIDATFNLYDFIMSLTPLRIIIDNVSSAFVGFGESIYAALNGIVSFLQAHSGEIKSLFATAWSGVSAVVKSAIDTTTSVVQALAPVVLKIFGEIKKFLDTNGSTIFDGIATAITRVSGVVSTVFTIIKTVAVRVLGEIGKFIDTHGDGIQRVMLGAYKFISGEIGKLLDTLEFLGATALAVANKDWDTAWGLMGAKAASVSADVTKSINSMDAGLTTLVNTLDASLPTAINSLDASLAESVNRINNSLTESMNGLGARWDAFWAGVGASVAGGFNSVDANLTAAMNALGAKWDGFWGAIGLSVGTAFTEIQSSAAAGWATFTTWFSGVWQTLSNAASVGIYAIKNTIFAVIGIMSLEWQFVWNTFIAPVVAVWLEITGAVVAGAAAVGMAINSKLLEIVAFMEGKWNEISATTTTKWNEINDSVNKVLDGIKNVISEKWDAITKSVGTALNTITSVVSSKFGEIFTTVSSKNNEIESSSSSKWAEIQNAISTKASESSSAVGKYWDLILSDITTIGGQIQNDISLKWGAIVSYVDGQLSILKSGVSSTFNNMVETISAMMKNAETAIANGVEAFIAKFNNLKDKMSVIGQQLLEGMVQGIRDKVGWLVTEGQRAAQAVLDAIKNTLGVNSPAKEAVPYGEAIPEGMALGINDESNLSENAGADMATRTIERVRVALAPLPQIVAPIMAQTASTMVNAWSGLNDDLEDQILGAAESIVELAESGDSASLVFAKSFEVLRQTITGIVPSFNDSKSAITRMHETLAAGKFDVQAYWKIYEEMMHGIGRTTSETMPVVARTTTEAIDEMGLSARWFAESFEDQILTASESFVELAQTGDVTSLNFARAFDAIKLKLFELVPAFTGGQDAMQAMHDAMAGGQFDVEAYWKAYDTLMQEIKTSMEISQNVATTTMQTMADTVVSTTQTMQQQASSAAQSIAASMIAAGEVINTTQVQLANFIQSGGIGGITGGTYTPSQAFQDSFKNPPAVAAPRPSSVPKPTVTNNTPINITITGGNVDRYAVEDGTTAALRRAGLLGRFS